MARLYTAPPTEKRRAVLEEIFEAPIADLDDRLSHLSADHRAELKIEPGSFAFLTWAIDALEQLLGASIPGCDRTYPQSDVSFSYATWTSTAKVSISVKRNLSEIRAVLDPQSWDACSGYFEATYVAEKVNGDYPIDSAHNAGKDPAPPTPGTGWEKVLFEHFVVDLGFANLASFKVLLDITSKAGSGVHDVGYELRNPVHATLGWMEQAGGIDIDQGGAKATQCEVDTICIDATKQIRLADWGGSLVDFWMNFWTSFALEMMSDETYEGVCCNPS